MQTLSTGAQLQHGTYRIEKVLGQGGFGITYLATDINLQRKVAIKEFFPKDFCDRDETTSHVTLGTKNTSEFVNRLKAKFLKEARNIAKFDHPNIIRIYAAFEENNTAYYVMEYIEGESLSSIVKKYGPIQERLALHYIGKVGKALEYVHARKINHLDVKPANIMVRMNDDTPILIDFGLSKQYDSEGNQTSTMPPGFSHGYAPMEQYNEGGVKEFSPQTDIYSLAATLYYALSGVVPPQATRLIEEELTFPESIPARLIASISKAMSSMRTNRQSCIKDFLEEIESAKAVSDDTTIETLIEKPKPKPKHSNKGKEGEKVTQSKKQPVKPKKKLSKWIWISAIGVIAIVIGVDWYNGHTIKEDTEVVVATPRTATDLFWESSLGDATYSGEVIPDTLLTGEIKMIPNGKGKARILTGQFKGSIYDGQFVKGIMEGETVYTLARGDVFKGTFKANKYDIGRYTIKESGEYFEGSFKNMEPYRGKWYSANGKFLEEI